MNHQNHQNPTRSLKDSVGPSTTSAYLDPQYWDQRFSSEEHYEWLKDYSHFRHLIQPHIKPHSSSSVLELGCGNSQLCEELYKDGITDLTCIDLSSVAVDKMQRRLLSKGYKDIKVLEADMLNLPFDKESFDVVIEKGTMEVLFVDSGDPWNPRPETVNKVMTMLQGVHRVLKPDGVFISISFGQPHFRRPLFEAPEFTWSVEWNTFGDGFHYFFYILKKALDRISQFSRSDLTMEAYEVWSPYSPPYMMCSLDSAIEKLLVLHGILKALESGKPFEEMRMNNWMNRLVAIEAYISPN